MKKILMSLLVIALMMGVLGAAFAQPLSSFTGVGILARGRATVPDVGVDHMSYLISSGVSDPAALAGVELSFTKNLSAPVIFISVRNASDVELAYYAGVEGYMAANTNYMFYLYDTGNTQYVPGVHPVNHPSVYDVADIVVTAGENSSYKTP